MSESKLTPRHVAIIMDGNGRWAQLRGRERYYGHMQGVEPVRAAVRAAIRRGVRYLTLYAFSTENWGRPAEEIDALMELFCRSVASETPELCKQGVRIAMIGDRSRFPAKVQEYLAQAERETAGGERLTLILALNYSSRSELVRAVRLLAGRVAAGELPAEAIDEQTVGSALYTAPYPDPDLVIRTSGEMRLSNFLVAVLLRRTLFPRRVVARFHGGRLRPCDGGLRTTRPPFRISPRELGTKELQENR